jgi:hypothetical protein
MNHEDSRDSLGFLKKNNETNDSDKHLLQKNTKK